MNHGDLDVVLIFSFVKLTQNDPCPWMIGALIYLIAMTSQTRKMNAVFYQRLYSQWNHDAFWVQALWWPVLAMISLDDSFVCVLHDSSLELAIYFFVGEIWSLFFS